MLITLCIVLFLVSVITRIGKKIRKAFADLEALPTVPAQEAAPSKTEMPEQDKYFSYEQEMVDTAFQTEEEPSHRLTTSPVVEPVRTPAFQNTVDFDLRQAVICQTILHNPYVTESRQ